MNAIYLAIVIFILLLAVFDIVVGVSNDAVNFINSAIGSKVAKFSTILFVSAIGVFAGASLSNGMMDIARHGIFAPQYFSFRDVMCIFLAVMVTDVVMLDVFNSKGMPTSTTVSMVFELLGGSFALALYKVLKDGALNLGMLLNTDKAFQVIIAIFISVAIAFIFGWIVQYLTRILFTFTYSKGTRVRQGIFAGISLTAIVYFLLINGLKGSTLMTTELKAFIDNNTWLIVGICFAGFSVLMTLLSLFKVNVLKIVVLSGTFALAMAFAGNDLVNFIGVPLAGLSSYQDFVFSVDVAPDAFIMTSLQDSAKTPILFLIGAGLIMVITLITSKKARNVVKTSVDLSRQDEGDEMFGSSFMARSLVRHTLNISQAISRQMPESLKRFVDRRFNVQDAELEDGAAFDSLRASVNLVLAGLLVALGTSLKLPLSTTYVTFMVAMGTSLADRAWTRESAVFRITGVLNVIGSWFITAGVAFLLCFIITTIMHFGGFIAMLAFIVLAIMRLVNSYIQYAKKNRRNDPLDLVFTQIQNTKDGDYGSAQKLIITHNKLSNIELLDFVRNELVVMTDAFFNDEYQPLKNARARLNNERARWKRIRKREILGMRRIDPRITIEKNTWFFLASNSAEQMLYGLKRIAGPCAEHLGNKQSPLPDVVCKPYRIIRFQIITLFDLVSDMIKNDDFELSKATNDKAKHLQHELSNLRKEQMNRMTINDKGDNMPNAELIYINILQESQEMLSCLRHLLRGIEKLHA